MHFRNTRLATLALCLSACSGAISGGNNGTGATTNPPPPSTVPTPTDPPGGLKPGETPPASCSANSARATALHGRLLSPSQYDNTVQDLLKVGGDPAKEFVGGADSMLDDVATERRAAAAAAVAKQAVAGMATWAPCAATAAGCEQQIIDQVGTRAYRRPLTDGEKAEMARLFDAGVKEKDFATGLEWFLTGVLQTPDFLYQFVRPVAGEQTGKLQGLSGYELASRLSYFVWDSMPDDQLFTAAGKGLGDVASVQAQLDRMVADKAHFTRGVQSFYSSWLGIDGFDELARDDMAFTSDLVHSLGTSLLMSATQLYQGTSPNISGLLGGQSYYMNGTLRAFYGMPGGGADFTAVDLPNEGRSGILTHPALLAQLARPQKTHPINRGLFVRGKLLCQEMVPPPGLMFPPLPEAPVMGVTTREEIIDHARPECKACHDLIDPPGFALENFDQVGRRRTMENGVMVDSSGTMSESGDLDGPFATGGDLLKRVADSKTVRGCFAQQYFQFAVTDDLSRTVAMENQCSVDIVGRSFATSGDLKQLVLSIATSDAFRFRVSEGAGQ
jgi:hypothetical protein